MTTLQIRLTPEEYFAGTLVHLYWWPRQAGRASALAVLVIGGYAIVRAVSSEYAPTGENLVFLYVALLLFSYAAQRFRLACRTRRLFARQESFGRPYEFAFDERGLKTTIDGAIYPIAWPEIVKWREGAGVFLLYRAEPLYQIVPKRAFPNALAIDEFRAPLRGKVAARPGAAAMTVAA